MWTQVATVRSRLNIASDVTTFDTIITRYIHNATMLVKKKLKAMTGDLSMPTQTTLLSTTATATMTLTSNLPTSNIGRKVRVRVKGGTTNTGTVTLVDGTTTEGLAESETLTFTGSSTIYSTKMFTSLTLTDGVTTTGLADEDTVPTVEIWGEIPQELRDITADLAVAMYNIDYNIDLGSDAVDAGPKAMIDRAMDNLKEFIKYTYTTPNASRKDVNYRRCAP